MYIYLDENNYVYGYGSDKIENSVTVDNIPQEVDESLGCYQYLNGEFILDESKADKRKSESVANQTIREIENWFAWYDTQCMQYQRSIRLGVEFDKNIDELDAEAVTNAARIKELRAFLASTYTE